MRDTLLKGIKTVTCPIYRQASKHHKTSINNVSHAHVCIYGGGRGGGGGGGTGRRGLGGGGGGGRARHKSST